MAENLEEIDAIADNPEPPTFENTIVAMERAGRDLDRVLDLLRHLERQPLDAGVPRDPAGDGAEAVASSARRSPRTRRCSRASRRSTRAKSWQSLRPDQQRLVWLVYDGFARNGATLEGEAKERYAEINQRLAELHTQFANNVLADEEGYVTYLTEDQLGGLPDSFVQAAAAAAAERGARGRVRHHQHPLVDGSVPDLLRRARAAREGLADLLLARRQRRRARQQRADRRDPALRNERVQLLGYDNYAAWRLENRMAKTPERAFELMEAVWPAALAAGRRGGRRHAGDRRRGGRRDHASSRGTTATTPRRCARPSTTSIPTR